MSAAINEPFLLSSYGLSKSLPKGTGELNRGSTYVFSTHGNGLKSVDGYATVTAQGDGVHVLDVSTLHPVVSHTLGPSTLFSCPAVSRTTPGDGTATYAVIESSSDVNSEESGRTVWMWRRGLSTIAEKDSRKKQSTVVSHRISKLFLPDDLPSRVVLLSPKGDLSVVDADLAFKSTLQSKNDKQVLLRSFNFSCKSCPFIPTRNLPQNGCVILLIFLVGNKPHAHAVVIAEDDKLTRLGDCVLPLEKESSPTTIVGISCSESGHLSILTRSGIWNSFQLQYTNESISVATIVEPIYLGALSALTSGSQAGASSKSYNEISLLSLGSSFVLLAGTTRSPSREIVFLLWDLQYSVLLASHTIQIPSTLSQADKGGLVMELIAASAGQALLVLTPATHVTKGKAPELGSSLRSTVLVVPFTVPRTSTIANAMGRASHNVKWLAQDASSSSTHAELDTSQVALFKSMRDMIDQNRPEAASTTFFEWTQRRKQSTLKTQQPDVSLSHEFVKIILDIVLQPGKASVQYSSKVLEYLLEHRAVSASMVESGLLSTLRLRDDWRSILMAFNTVLDISEEEIVSVLQSVISHHKKNVSQDDAMQVDSTLSNIPSLPTFLSLCISYTTSPATLRLAIRKYLPDAEDIFCVLEILDGWIEKWSSVTLKLLPTDVSKNSRGVTVAKLHQAKRTVGPPLDDIISFLQTLLDASFLTLLQYAPAHDLLRRISLHLEPELDRVDQMEQLRGPLEPFARAQVKALKESVEGNKDGQVDWRRRRKAAHEQAGVAVGLYRLEELVI